ncbi:hypothetical protein [uncultured Mitsuokella sp.]|uniref:hypothetical protein n=1 Tax=uncultured Mitsuokella sp. TaxID=453120 RepID=UPI0026073B2F|nr:hypothetical protein [uncultured Mitsuokella sp.]
MKKFYEVLRESYNVETFKHYNTTKVFENLEDAIAYAKRYSRDCGGKRHFTDMAIYECTPKDDVYEVDAFSADMLRSSDECKILYVAICSDGGVLHACDEKAEQTSASSESEEADTADASSTDDKANDDSNTDEDADVIDESYDEGYGTAMCDGEEYILLNEPYEDNNSSGEAAFFARAVKVGDKFDGDDQVPCYMLEFKIINPDWEYEAEDASLDTYVYYDHDFGFCI